jgi:hypothetical protein
MCQCDKTLEPSKYTRSHQQIGTELVVALHLLWASSAGRHAQREHALLLGEILFERCLLGFDFEPEVLSKTRTAGVCFCSEAIGGECPHIRKLSLDTICSTHSPQVACWQCLVRLLPCASKCGLAKHMVKCFVARVVKCMHSSLEEKMVQIPPHRVAMKLSGPTKRRRAPDTYRSFILQNIKKSVRGSNGKAVMKVDGYSSDRHYAWMQKEVSAYQYSCNRGAPTVEGVHGLWEDAAKLGKPAKEILLMIGESCRNRSGCVLPPMVSQFSSS